MNVNNNYIQRNSSFELLRIFLMFLIVVHHCIVHGYGIELISNGNRPENISSNTTNFLLLINAFCICGVNTFILISGYFGIQLSNKRLYKILFPVIFYTFIFSTLYYFFSQNYILGIRSIFFIAQSKYWFIVDYIFLLPFTTIINSIFIEWSKKRLIYYVLFLIIISCYYGFFWHNNINYNGYTFFQFLTLYSLGRLIKRLDVTISKIKSSIIYLTSSSILGISCIFFLCINLPKISWQMTFYNNPLIVLSSCGMLLYFKDINFQNKLINHCAKSAFAIYLIQSSPFISETMYRILKQQLINFAHDPIMIFGFLLIVSILVVCISIIFDQIQIKFSNILYHVISKKLVKGKQLL